MRHLFRCHAIFDYATRHGRCERFLIHRGFHKTHLWGPSLGTAHW